MLPLLSCIMPTANRRRFVPRAIGYFLAQDYPHKELVVLDDGQDSVADLMPDDPRVRYVRLDRRHSLGSKRNLACEAARGKIIAHWDDDDWHAPHRLSYQVEGLMRPGIEACGTQALLYYDLRNGQAWQYRYPPGQRFWLAGGTLCYWRSFWQKHRFANVTIGEDARFVWSGPPGAMAALPDHLFYVAVIHPGNSSPKSCRGAYWSRWSGDLRLVMGGDLDFYQATGQAEGEAPVAPDEPAVALGKRVVAPGKPAVLTLIRREADIDEPHSEERWRMNQPEKPIVTVSIPYFRCRPYIRKAVDSVLSQSFARLRLVVVNDGDEDSPWDQLADIHDPRLVRFDLKGNHGRYFADAVVLNATPDPYFMIQDADDWSEPQRLETLLWKLRESYADASISGIRFHRGKPGNMEGTREESVRDALVTPLTQKFEHRVSHCCLFRSESLRNVGGYYGGFRIGYDTLVMNLLLMTGRVTYVNQPLYNRLVRPDSLVNSSATGLRSPARLKVKGQLQAIYRHAFATYQSYLAGDIEADALVNEIRTLCGRHVAADEKAALLHETERLRAVLNSPQPANTANGGGSNGHHPSVPARAVTTRPESSYMTGLSQLINHNSLSWEGWKISRIAAVELAKRLERLKPRRILELGSGNSTAILALYATQHGAEVISLEHEPSYYAETEKLLTALDLRQAVQVQLAPLAPLDFGGGRQGLWYGAKLSGEFDFILVDGPPEKHGREGALYALNGHLAPQWELWLHDGNRPHERSCVANWSKQFKFSCALHSIDEKGVWILSHNSEDSLAVLPQGLEGRLGISFLTGNRLSLLKQTMESLQAHWPGLVDRSYTLVMVNGEDAASQAYVDSLPYVNNYLRNTQKIMPTGVATSTLMAEMLRQADVEYILHMEDDWCISTVDKQWLCQAHHILENNPEVGQVRLRHYGEKVLPHHMVTKNAIGWEAREAYLYAREAHFTFNPNLMRARDVARVYPCASEADAQRRFLKTRLASAQLAPGVFRHIGEKHSLQRGHLITREPG